MPSPTYGNCNSVLQGYGNGVVNTGWEGLESPTWGLQPLLLSLKVIMAVAGEHRKWKVIERGLHGTLGFHLWWGGTVQQCNCFGIAHVSNPSPMFCKQAQ